MPIKVCYMFSLYIRPAERIIAIGLMKPLGSFSNIYLPADTACLLSAPLIYLGCTIALLALALIRRTKVLKACWSHVQGLITSCTLERRTRYGVDH
jgi:hypothetical protein